MSSDDPGSDFEQRATAERGSALAEIWSYLRVRKKFWLLPIILVLLIFGVLAFASATGGGPLIYTLF